MVLVAFSLVAACFDPSPGAGGSTTGGSEGQGSTERPSGTGGNADTSSSEGSVGGDGEVDGTSSGACEDPGRFGEAVFGESCFGE